MIRAFAKSRRNRKRKAAAYLADESGASAVEFALIAGPFLLLLTGVIEVGLMLIASVDLKDSTADIAREIRIGTSQCLTRDEIEQRICDSALLLPNCSERLVIERSSSPLGFGAGMADLLAGDTFKEVKGGEVVLIQASYKWAISTPLLAEVMGDPKGDMEIEQSFVFQNETYGAQACP